MDVPADLCAASHRGPGVDHGAAVDVGPDVHVGRHQDDPGGDIGPAARQRPRDDAGSGGAEAVRIEGGVLQGHLVEEAYAAVADRFVVVDAEVQQHGLFQPFVDGPAAVTGFGDAQFAGVESADAVLHGFGDFGARVAGLEIGAVFPGRFDHVNQLRHGFRSPGGPRPLIRSYPVDGALGFSAVPSGPATTAWTRSPRRGDCSGTRPGAGN